MTEFYGRIGHLEGIESPWSNAGGVVKTVADVEVMARTGVGTIEDGSQTLLGRFGNAVDAERPELGPVRTVYYHNPETGETANSLGMPGKGMDVAEAEIPEKVKISEAHGKKFIQNVAPVSEDPARESYELVSRAYGAGAHAVLLNAGCPNVVTADGGRHELLSRNPRALSKVLLGLQPLVERYAPVFVRISPQESYDEMKKICAVIRNSGVVSAVYLPNTWPGFVPKNEQGEPILQVPGGVGGKSGPATAGMSAEQTDWATYLLRNTNVDVVRSSGIMDAAELKEALANGAVAGAGTTFFYESTNGWADDTDRLLSELAA